MKNKLLKKTKYSIASALLGSTLLIGSAYASPTEITITANKEGYTKMIKENQPLKLSTGETLNLSITAYDEDGIESHQAYISSHKLGTELHSKGLEYRSRDGKTSNLDLNLSWPMKDNLHISVYVKDKKGNTEKKTLDVYFE